MKTEIFISKRKGKLNISIPLEAVKKLLEEKVCPLPPLNESLCGIKIETPSGIEEAKPETADTTGVPLDNNTTAGNPEINPTITQ